MAITKITSGVIDSGTITSANIEDGTIVNDDINASAAIVNTKLSGVLTNAGIVGVSTFTASGTWTKATREAALGVTIKRVIVEVQGAGGSGGRGSTQSSLNAGGAGGYAKKLIDVSSISSSTITVGTGGAAAGGGTGNSGGASSWNDGTNTLTGNGGQGAVNANYRGGAGGTASGGDININGQYGGEWAANQTGGNSMFGFGGNFSYDNNSARPGTGYGSGGTAIHTTYASGNSGPGANGIVIVTEIAG